MSWPDIAWRLLVFSRPGTQLEPFGVWEATDTAVGVIAAGASPSETRRRLAAKMIVREEGEDDEGRQG